MIPMMLLMLSVFYLHMLQGISLDYQMMTFIPLPLYLEWSSPAFSVGFRMHPWDASVPSFGAQPFSSP